MLREKITVIRPTTKFNFVDLGELWRYRELLLTFVKRDLKVRYRQTIIGGLWAILQPFSTMVIFSFFFGHLANISGGSVPYPIFSYAGLVLWVYFSNAINSASGSMVANANLITKVYFPRIIIPIATTITGLVDYLIAITIIVGLMLFYHIAPTFALLLIPLTVGLAWLLAIGIGFWLSAINVKYRDVGYVLPFFIQMLLFVTPVIYPTSIAPNFKSILMLNPMTGIIEAHRAMILGTSINWEGLGISALIVTIILITGSAYFHTVEKYFADII